MLPLRETVRENTAREPGTVYTVMYLTDQFDSPHTGDTAESPETEISLSAAGPLEGEEVPAFPGLAEDGATETQGWEEDADNVLPCAHSDSLQSLSSALDRTLLPLPLVRIYT